MSSAAGLLIWGLAGTGNAADISGRIGYYSNGAAVGGASVQLHGPAPTVVPSDTAGQYAFTGLAGADWSVVPSKLGDVGHGLSALDAVYALQAAVGLRTLTARQRLACDVTGNGTVSTLDAAIIFQHVLGLIPRLPVAQLCNSDWAFVPDPAAVTGQRQILPQISTGSCQLGGLAFEPLQGDASGQDFAAVLFGDCTGNWEPTGPPPTPTPIPTVTPTPTIGPPQQLRVEVLAVYPHDPGAFTEGLLRSGDALYESTGPYVTAGESVPGGLSSVRQVDPTTGVVTRQRTLPSPLFGEGLARAGNRLIQLTWQDHVAFVYDLASFDPMGQFSYTGEGWGLCFDGQQLVMSNGSATLSFRDPDTFAVQRQVDVTLNGQPQYALNELECIGDTVYANVFTTDTMVRIDPRNGVITGVIDASGLLTAEERSHTDYLNGIAYDPQRNTFLLTGKFFPKLFEVVFVPVVP